VRLSAADPVVADWELVTTDSVNESEAKRAAADTALLTEAELEATETESQTSSPAAEAPPPDTDEDIEESEDNPSAYTDDDIPVDDDAGAQDARRRGDPTKPLRPRFRSNLDQLRFGLTESDPKSLDSSDYTGANGLRSRWPHLRPIVSYRMSAIKRKPNRDGGEKLRLARWEEWYRRARDRGYKADISFSRDGPEGGRPTVRGYRRGLRLFFGRTGNAGEAQFAYKGVTASISAWNEPNFKDDPLRGRPKLAAELWTVAQSICHPKDPPAGFKPPCRYVVAGEFAGRPGEPKLFRVGGTPVGYTKAYKH
jgi:hypothetical protein